MNEVFILGSGFSKAINNEMPLLSDLNKKIEDKIFSENKEGNIYKQLYIDLISSNHFVNFEEILTYLYQNYPWKSEEDRNLGSALYIYLVRIMTEILIKEEEKFTITKENQDIFKFIQYIILNNSHVITFNYDTMLEKITIENFRPYYSEEIKGVTNLNYVNTTESINGIRIFVDFNKKFTSSENKIKVIENNKIIEFYVYDHNLEVRELEDFYTNKMKENYDRGLFNAFKTTYSNNIQNEKFSELDFYFMPFTTLPRRTTTIFGTSIHESYRLYKLHGSTNLYYFKDNISSQIYLAQGHIKLKVDEDLGKKDLIPLIIPPIFDKSIFMNVNAIRTIWTDAKNAIRSADKIYIIGYSIPESDLTVKYLLKSNISDKAQIFLINIDLGMKDRIESYF